MPVYPGLKSSAAVSHPFYSSSQDYYLHECLQDLLRDSRDIIVCLNTAHPLFQDKIVRKTSCTMYLVP